MFGNVIWIVRELAPLVVPIKALCESVRAGHPVHVVKARADALKVEAEKTARLIAAKHTVE